MEIICPATCFGPTQYVSDVIFNMASDLNLIYFIALNLKMLFQHCGGLAVSGDFGEGRPQGKRAFAHCCRWERGEGA